MLVLCDLKKLEEILYCEDKVFLFGAGRRLMLFEKIVEKELFKHKLFGVIDNDILKNNAKVSLWEEQYSIFSYADAKRFVDNKTIIIITVEYYADILDQLEKDDIYSNCIIVCLTHIIGIEADLKSLSKKAYINKGTINKIPKVIHYFWFGGKPLPERYNQWISSWKKFCPDYEIIQWNEKNYDVKKNRYMYQAYKNAKWGFVPDYARIDVVSQYGGLYFDTDVEIVHTMDDLLYDDAFMGFESDELVNLGQGFGSVKGNELLLEMKDMYNYLEFEKENGELNMKASPYYQTDVLVKNGLVLNGEQQKVKNTVIYPEKMFCSKNIKTMSVSKLDYTHSIHHFDGSWADEKSKNFNIRLSKDFDKFYRKK